MVVYIGIYALISIKAPKVSIKMDYCKPRINDDPYLKNPLPSPDSEIDIL